MESVIIIAAFLLILSVLGIAGISMGYIDKKDDKQVNHKMRGGDKFL